jgi:hypothetical protein
MAKSGAKKKYTGKLPALNISGEIAEWINRNGKARFHRLILEKIYQATQKKGECNDA